MEQKEKFIREISKNFSGFSPSPFAVSTSLRWTFLAFAIILGVSSLIGSFRPNLYQQFLAHPKFGVEVVLGLAIVFFASWSVLALSTPGDRTKKIILFLLFIGALFIGSIGFSYYKPSADTSMIGKRAFCFLEGVIYGLLLSVSLIFLASRRAPYNRITIGLFSAISSVALTTTLMHLACMYVPTHIVSHHIAPILIVAPISVLASILFIKND